MICEKLIAYDHVHTKHLMTVIISCQLQGKAMRTGEALGCVSVLETED